MKKLSFLLLPLIAAIFIGGILYLCSTGFQANTPVSLSGIHTERASKAPNSEITGEGKININIASKEALMLLNGVGEKLAERIIIYREENGPYTDITELLNVSGIGEETLNNIIDQIAVE